MRKEDIAANVRAVMARKQPRMTARTLAEQLGAEDGSRALRRRLRGQVEFTATELVAIARVLGVDVDDLTREEV